MRFATGTSCLAPRSSRRAGKSLRVNERSRFCGALVCGFSDLAAGLGGLAWALGDRGGLLLSDDAVHEATVEISGDDALDLRLKSAAGEIEAALSPRTERVSLEMAEGGAPPGGKLEAAICEAKVKPADQGRTIPCFGHLSRWSADPPGGPGIFRHLAIERSDGSLLLVVAQGDGGEGHGTEEVAAWLLDREGGFVTFSEALLSTQYDKAGQHTRTGLELWPDEDEVPPMRAAGTRLGGTGANDLSAAFLRCSSEGSEGLGSYLIRRG